MRNTPDRVYREICKEALACRSTRLRMIGYPPSVCGYIPLEPYPGSH